MKIAIQILFLLNLSFFWGCQSSAQKNEKPLLIYSEKVLFLPVSIHIWGPEQSQSNFKIECYGKIHRKFRESGFFKNVSIKEKKENHIEIVYDWENLKDGVVNLTHTIVTGASLGVVPQKYRIKHFFFITVKDSENVIRRYKYENVAEGINSILDTANPEHIAWFEDGVNPMINQFLKDLEDDQYLLNQ